MLSYQHIYHAGNAADLHKHLWLITVLQYLVQKDKPFSWVDTHAGRGLYDLRLPEAQKTAEYKGGFLKIWQQLRKKDDLPAPLHFYFQVIEAKNPSSEPHILPGSAVLTAELLRPKDRLYACDLHKGEFPFLETALTPYPRATASKRDGLEALTALSPPLERRGGALIDPSYEIKTDYMEIAKRVAATHKKWAQGIYMIWYPLLPAGHHRTLLENLAGLGSTLLVDEWIWGTHEDGQRGLYGSGMAIINAPFTCAETMARVRNITAPLL